MLIRGERMIAEELAAPPVPPAAARADPATRFEGKLVATVSRFSDPSTPAPNLGKESLMTVLAYVLARSPPPAEAPSSGTTAENHDSDAGG